MKNFLFTSFDLNNKTNPTFWITAKKKKFPYNFPGNCAENSLRLEWIIKFQSSGLEESLSGHKTPCYRRIDADDDVTINAKVHCLFGDGLGWILWIFEVTFLSWDVFIALVRFAVSLYSRKVFFNAKCSMCIRGIFLRMQYWFSLPAIVTTKGSFRRHIITFVRKTLQMKRFCRYRNSRNLTACNPIYLLLIVLSPTPANRVTR